MMALSKRTRFEIFKRDLFTCRYCGKRPPDVVLEVDHVIARKNGGTDDPDNLATSCADCNRGKAAVPLGESAPAVDELARLESIQDMLERANLAKQAAAAFAAKKEAEGIGVDLAMTWWTDIGGTEWSFQPASIRGFLRRLSTDDVYEAFQATGRWWEQFPRKTQSIAWRYFCGCCWQMVRIAAAAKGV